MPTLKETTESIDARVSELMGFIEQTQEAGKQNGKYVQLDWSHATDPEDGAVKQPERLSHKLPGKAKTWTDFGYPTHSPSCTAAADEYVGPNGNGWALRMALKYGGKRYMRTVKFGPESSDTGWTAVPAVGV